MTELQTTYYWSRRPGKFVNKMTGVDIFANKYANGLGLTFSGSVREWYETLVETILDVSNAARQMGELFLEDEHGNDALLPIEPADLRVGPTALAILESSHAFKINIHAGSVKSGNIRGTLLNRFDVYLDFDIPEDEVHVSADGIVKILDMNG